MLRQFNQAATLASIIVLLLLATMNSAQAADSNNRQSAIRNQQSILLSAEGRVEISRNASLQWIPAQTNAVLLNGDRVRTGARSRATIRLSDLSVMRLNELTTVEIRPTDSKAPAGSFDARRGSLYFFNRERPTDVQFRSPVASGAIRGTEFDITVAENGSTEVTMFDGIVDLRNDLGSVSLTNSEQAVVQPGAAPRKTAVLDAIAIIQWALYYPGVLDPDEAGLTSDEQNALSASLTAYRAGDLLSALASYPNGRVPQSNAEKVYRAATLLAVGQVSQAQEVMNGVESRPANALRDLIAGVTQRRKVSPAHAPELATEWMVESYRLQGESRLPDALQAARRATEKSPRFGFAWVRLAELEFSFGHVREAVRALDKGLSLSPRNAQGLALRGFLFAAQRKLDSADRFFDEAISIDPALANAWLGRGLVKIRRGRVDEGRADLQTAATLEPRRAILRSYLGKAWDEAWDTSRAHKELRLAQKLDPNDPTAWLYIALLEEQENRINDAVRDLERSQELNENRSLFRSKFLLDEDRAIRSANLARIYQDDGMTDWSVREASRAVSYDYSSFSAHQFLANSYLALVDPRQINLRYEAPAVSEYFIANLLSPVGATPLSSTVSAQEYTRMFDRNHIGVASSTEYFSGGDWVQHGSQYGVIGGTEWSLDADYLTQNGFRPNNDFESLKLTARVKQELTPKDTVYLEAQRNEFESGDVVQYYDQGSASRTLRVHEVQEPNVLLGYHHEWSPGNHTIALAGRLEDASGVRVRAQGLELNRTDTGDLFATHLRPFVTRLHGDIEGYTAELQQILSFGSHTLVFGARAQTADSDERSLMVMPSGAFPGRTVYSNLVQSANGDITRVSGYIYDMWRVIERLQITAGVSYDYLSYPKNQDIPPLSTADEERSQISPKAGFLWMPRDGTTVRGAYTRSLGGVYFDNSYRLEPTEVGGFNQAFRSLIPESIAGSVPGTRFETFGAGLEQKLPTRTYITLSGEVLNSTGRRTVGAFNRFTNRPIPTRTETADDLDYRERSLNVSVNQLVGANWAFGVRYRLTDATLNERFAAIPLSVRTAGGIMPTSDPSGLLHQLNLYAGFNCSCGFFSRMEVVWLGQSNSGYSPALVDDNVWQLNIYAGYRFWHRHAEATVGLLNATDNDYKLSPLNLYSELPRERTFYASFKFYF